MGALDSDMVSRFILPDMNTATTPPDGADEVCELDLGIGGMTCASCVSRVERALKKLPGVQEATVNLATESARVRWTETPGAEDASGQPAMAARIQRAVRDAGYEPRPIEVDDAAAQATLLGLPRNAWPVLLGALLSLPLAGREQPGCIGSLGTPIGAETQTIG